MNGSWHRYRPGERWRRPPARARLVLEVPGAVAVCFDAPVVELFETRAEAIHPTLARLGPDLLDADWGPDAAAEARRRLRDPARAALTISDGAPRPARARRHRQHLAERDAVPRAGRPVDAASRDARRRDARPPGRDGPAAAAGERRRRRRAGHRCAVYRRAGRPCRRCGTLVRSAPLATRDPADDLLVPDLPDGAEPMTRDRRRVRRRRRGDGWTCAVTVRDDGGARLEHDVRVVAPATSTGSRPAPTDPTDLVERSFAFLLEREPPTIDPADVRPDRDRPLLPRVRGDDPAASTRGSAEPPAARIIAGRCASTTSPGPASRSGSTSCGRSPSGSSGSGWPASAGARPG